MKFTKMHGLGNDYILIDCLKEMPPDPGSLAGRLSDRHFGIGGDGLICVCPSETADFRMRMFNADGSEGAMCGNGIRCVGKFVFDKRLTRKKELTIETAAGERQLILRQEGGAVTSATVDMGAAEFGETASIYVNGNTYTGVAVSMGNPHFVIPTSDVKGAEVGCIGPLLQHTGPFPDGVNVGFGRAVSEDHIELRVWERGSGETMACGTGACAAAAAFHRLGLTGRGVTVDLPGGELGIVLRERDRHLLMTGPAVTVFEGEWNGTGE